MKAKGITGTPKFLFNGVAMQRDETLEDLGMEDGDEIEAMLEMTGGCF